jgi:hypothetical protein
VVDRPSESSLSGSEFSHESNNFPSHVRPFQDASTPPGFDASTGPRVCNKFSSLIYISDINGINGLWDHECYFDNSGAKDQVIDKMKLRMAWDSGTIDPHDLCLKPGSQDR